jgi:hypothetical protein
MATTNVWAECYLYGPNFEISLPYSSRSENESGTFSEEYDVTDAGELKFVYHLSGSTNATYWHGLTVYGYDGDWDAVLFDKTDIKSKNESSEVTIDLSDYTKIKFKRTAKKGGTKELSGTRTLYIKKIAVTRKIFVSPETASHTFDVPFDVNTDCSDCSVIYKLGLKVIITKNSDVLDIVSREKDGWHFSSITSHLSSEETALFHDTLLDAHVQIKFTMNDGATQYSEIYPVKVEDSLDNAEVKPGPTVILGFGWTED